MTKTQPGTIQQQLTEQGSGYKKYRQSVVGSGGLGQFLLYEIITSMFLDIPGSLGSRIRSFCMTLITSHMGKSVQLGAHCFFLQPEKLQLKEQVKIGKQVSFFIKPKGQSIVLEKKVEVGNRTILNCSGGRLYIGKGTKISADCRIGSLMGLSVGKECAIGKYTCISGAGHSISNLELPIILQPLVSKGKTVIGDHVQIGEGVTILDGVKIGNKARIAPFSLVNKDIADGAYVAGVPARLTPHGDE